MQCTLGECIWAAGTTREFNEDYGRFEGDRPFEARRMLARIRDGDDVLWGWEPLDDDGCTTVFDLDTTPSTITIDRARWTVSPSGHSILGYECELSDGGGSPTGPDGACNPLDTPSVSAIAVGGMSSDCGGAGQSVDHCTIHTVQEGPALQPIDYNLWGTTFSDSRINGAGAAQLYSPTQIYILQETDDGNETSSNAGYWLGGHPTVRYKASQWHSKFGAAHEYGHLAFLVIPSLQDDPSHPVVPADLVDGGNGHAYQSPEWHALAATEGFAHMAAALTWHDISDSVVLYVVLPEEGIDGQISDTRSLVFTGSAPGCTPGSCNDGQSTELNWAIALREFMLTGGSPSIPLIGGMLPAVHAYDWVPDGNDDFFEIAFDEVMDPAVEDYFGSQTLYDDWTDLAIDLELRDATL